MDTKLTLKLNGEIIDFEDAIQYNCALQQKIEWLITRNLKAFKKASIHVMTPEMLLSLRDPL